MHTPPITNNQLPITYRITLIGGGIAGLMLAYKAVSAGHAVTLYEANTIASGASGKALGVLVPVTGLNRPIDILQRQGIAAWPALAQQLADETNTPLTSFWRDWGEGRQQLNITTIFSILATAIRTKGGTIVENHPITNLTEVRQNANHVILTAGYGTKALTGAPVTISTGIAARFTGHIDGLIAQDNLFLCPDFTENEVLAGSVNWSLKEPHTGPIPSDKRDELLRRVAALAPHLQLKDLWLGNRPAQTPRTPLITSPEPTLHITTALGKIGMGLSPALELPF
jgi:glycine/D-amino acid oxidase-like deaminating enzyme